MVATLFTAIPAAAADFTPVACSVEAAGPATGAADPAPAGGRIVRVGARERYGRNVDIDFQGSRSADGSVSLDGTSGDLSFRHIVRAGTGFSIELAAGPDKVSIVVDPGKVRVTHNKKSRTFSPDSATDDELDQVAALLGGSRAVRRFRTVAAAVQESGDSSGFSSAVLIADALVGEATGDTGATRRVADHLTRRARARLKKVAFEGFSCYDDWEKAVIGAANELEDCVNSFAWYNPWQYACSLPWYLEVLSAWGVFLTCSAGG